jgi:hypothetical protein
MDRWLAIIPSIVHRQIYRALYLDEGFLNTSRYLAHNGPCFVLQVDEGYGVYRDKGLSLVGDMMVAFL